MNLFGDRVFTYQVKVRGNQVKVMSLGCALIQYDWCYKKQKIWGHLGGLISWGSDSWFLFTSWSQGHEIEFPLPRGSMLSKESAWYSPSPSASTPLTLSLPLTKIRKQMSKNTFFPKTCQDFFCFLVNFWFRYKKGREGKQTSEEFGSFHQLNWLELNSVEPALR